MAGADELLGSADVRKVGAALLFLGAGTNVYDAFSAVMSSPWSTEKFSQGPEEQAMAREYVLHGLTISGGYAFASAYLARSIWPIVGAAGVAAYMYWLYARALRRAQANESQGADLSGAKPASSSNSSSAAEAAAVNGATTILWGAAGG
jgi:hypothetical protein